MRQLADWRPWLAAGAGAAVALILGLFRLDFQPLWSDERATVAVAMYPTERFLARITIDEAYIALYYSLMRAWSTLGTDPFVMRLPSVIFGLLTVLVVYVIAKRLFERVDVAFAAALLTATNAFVIRYEQEARVHILTTMLVALSALALTAALDRPNVRRWLAYAVVTALSIYGHLFAALVVPVHLALAIGLRRLDWIALRAYVLIGAMLVPLGLLTVLFRRPVDWIEMPGPRTLPRVFNMLAGGPQDADRLPIHLLAFGAAAAIGLVVGLREPRQWRFVLLAGWAVFPLLAAFVGSYVYQPMIVARYFLFSAPPLMILAAYGVMSLPQRWQRWSALGGLLVVAAYGLWWLYFVFEKTAAPIG